MLALLGACNAKEEPEKIDAEIARSVAVTKFSLHSDSKVMDGLDSVFFSIDLAHGVIYNADSLPMGTKINKLVPIITYPASVSAAEIIMTGGETRTGTVDYKTNPSDTIDFSGNVELRLTSAGDGLEMSYRIKVNVHTCVPDSLMWDKEAVASLPSRMAAPVAQRTLPVGNGIISLIEESDGSYTLASCKTPSENQWTKKPLALSFRPQIRTLTACGQTLYMLSEQGVVMTSGDNAETWTQTNLQWLNIIGEYDGTLLGITGDSDSPMFDIYPRPDGFTPYLLPADFPLAELSAFNTFSSKWASKPDGFFTGGQRNGNISAATWAYDGENWAVISNTPLPPLKGASIIPYFSYRKTTSAWIQTEYSVWLCMGGIRSDGKVNDVLYISYDNGINWRRASDLMQYPSFVKPGYQADCIIWQSPMEADMNAAWKRIASAKKSPQMRLKYNIDGDDITWDCPYIYLFGGTNDAGTLNSEIRRAVLARLTFAPIF